MRCSRLLLALNARFHPLSVTERHSFIHSFIGQTIQMMNKQRSARCRPTCHGAGLRRSGETKVHEAEMSKVHPSLHSAELPSHNSLYPPSSPFLGEVGDWETQWEPCICGTKKKLHVSIGWLTKIKRQSCGCIQPGLENPQQLIWLGSSAGTLNTLCCFEIFLPSLA